MALTVSLHFPHSEISISQCSLVKVHQQLVSLSSATSMSPLDPYPTGVNWADTMHHRGSISEVGSYFIQRRFTTKIYVRGPFTPWPNCEKQNNTYLVHHERYVEIWGLFCNFSIRPMLYDIHCHAVWKIMSSKAVLSWFLVTRPSDQYKWRQIIRVHIFPSKSYRWRNHAMVESYNKLAEPPNRCCNSSAV